MRIALTTTVALLAVGVTTHFVARRTEQGRELFAPVNARVDDVVEAVRDGYRARVQQLEAAANAAA